MTRNEVEELRNKYVGKQVEVHIDDPYHPINTVGTILEVDDMGQLHGTWGGLAAMPDEVTLSNN